MGDAIKFIRVNNMVSQLPYPFMRVSYRDPGASGFKQPTSLMWSPKTTVFSRSIPIWEDHNWSPSRLFALA